MQNFKQINIQQAQSLIQSKPVTVVDIRDPHSYESGHIKEAVRVSDQNIDEFIQNTPKDRPVICYCYHGISSQDAASFLCENGFQEVYSLDGGYEAWRESS